MESGKVEEEGKFSDQVCGGSEVHRGGQKRMEWEVDGAVSTSEERSTDRQTGHMQLSQSRGPGSRERAGRRVYGKIMRGRSRHPSTTKGQLHNGCFFSEERGNGNGGHTRLIRRRRCTLWRAKDGGEGKKDSILPF